MTSPSDELVRATVSAQAFAPLGAQTVDGLRFGACLAVPWILRPPVMCRVGVSGGGLLSVHRSIR